MNNKQFMIAKNMGKKEAKKPIFELTDNELIDALKEANLPTVFSYRMAYRAGEKRLLEKNK